jgi:hypothetical protein
MSAIHAPPSVVRWWGNLNNLLKERCAMMDTIDSLTAKLERVYVLADLLLNLLVGEPQAQVLAEIIMETSRMPED